MYKFMQVKLQKHAFSTICLNFKASEMVKLGKSLKKKGFIFHIIYFNISDRTDNLFY